ncbi:MAG: hypothetical protein ACRC33_29070, partial [Gemmataceae bacterium]
RRFARRLFAHPPLAHHPTCRCYDAHLIRVGPVALCLGCTCLGVGVAAGLLTTPALAGLGAGPLFLAGVGLYLPTLAQPFVQVRAFKAAARLLLGAAIVLLWLGGFVLPPLTPAGAGVRVGFVALFAAVFRLSMRLRARFTPRPCDICPHGRYPLCEGNTGRVERLLDELRAASPADAERAAGLVAAGDVDALSRARR